MRACWLALLLTLGCDGIGDPIVGESPLREPHQPACQQPQVECRRFVAQLPFPEPAAVDAASMCGGALSTAPCRDAQQGGGCLLALRVVEGSALELPAQSCATLELSPAPGSDVLELRASSIHNSRIVVQAQAPTTLVLRDIELSQVALELRGPITLQLHGNVRASSIRSEDAVQVTVTGSVLQEVALRMPKAHLRVQRSSLVFSQLRVRELELETVPYSYLDVTAERMIGIELSGERMRLDVGDLSLSEVEGTGLELHRCDLALLVDTRLNAPSFAACSQRLRAHSSALVGGRVDGTVESIGTYWGQMHFGIDGVGNTIELWGGTITSSVWCSRLTRLTLSSRTSVSCNDCTEVSEPERRLCSVPDDDAQRDADAGVVIEGNVNCPVFEQGLPECDPVPRQTSPI